MTSGDSSWVDDTLLDLEPEESGTSIAGCIIVQNVHATSFTMGLVQPFSGCRTLCLRQSHRTFHLQDSHHMQLLRGNQFRKEWLPCHSHNHRGLSQQQRSQTPRSQLIRSQLEQQNFEMMNTLQQKNQQQIKDLSAQLPTVLQAFLQQSMEQMFNRLAPAQTQPPLAASSSPPPHIVSITPV